MTEERPRYPSRYQMLRRVAQGGCGEVWEAFQPSLGRVVAVKKIRDDRLNSEAESESNASAFRREAAAMARLEHPNIAPVYGLEEDEDGLPRLAMKLVKGEAWSDLFAKDLEALAPLDLLDKHLPILAETCNAVAFAHSRGIVHRDLKLEQVIVGEFGEAILLDWGLAMIQDDPAAEAAEQEREQGEAERAKDRWEETAPSNKLVGGFLGTPALMAPEQAVPGSENVGPWTDVFLLGAMLYRLLTGFYPYEGLNAFESLRRAHQCAVEPPEERAPGRDIPAELSKLCLKAMRRERVERVASAKDFARGLRDYFTGASKRAESTRVVKELRQKFYEQSESYEDYADLLGRLDRAWALWPDNPGLPPLAEDIRLHCARAAVVQGDLTMATLHAARLVEEKNREFIFSEVETRRTQIKARERELEKRREAAIEQASATQSLIAHLLDDLRGSLDPDESRDRGLIERVAVRVVDHFLDLDDPLVPRELALKRAGHMAAVASSLEELGAAKGAERLLARSLLAREQWLGKRHEDVAEGLDALAAFYRRHGRPAEAEPMEKRSVRIRERAARPEGDSGRKILVVEDNQLNRYIMTRHLEQRGYTPIAAEDGAQGIEMARLEHPAMILMDMGLPVIDGWEATRRLKGDPATSGILVIGLSAHAEREDREKALAAGCDDYEVKPVDLPKLFAKIEAYLGDSSMSVGEAGA